MKVGSMVGLKGGGGSSPKGLQHILMGKPAGAKVMILPPTSMPLFFTASHQQPTSLNVKSSTTISTFTTLHPSSISATTYTTYPISPKIAQRPYTAHACIRYSEQPWLTPPTVSGVERTPSLHCLTSCDSSFSLVEGLLLALLNFSAIGSPSILLHFAGIEPALQ